MCGRFTLQIPPELLAVLFGLLEIPVNPTRYAYGKSDDLTDQHLLYENMGNQEKERQKAYREYVFSNRDRKRKN